MVERGVIFSSVLVLSLLFSLSLAIALDSDYAIPSENNVVLLLHMDGDAQDSSGSGNHMSVFGADCNSGGKFGNGCFFDGLGSVEFLYREYNILN